MAHNDEMMEDFLLNHAASAGDVEEYEMIRRGPIIKYEWEVQQRTCQGWECVTTEDSRREALARLREYRDNQPEYLARIVRKRVAQ